MADRRNVGLPGFPPGGMDMMQGRFIQPGGGYPPNMMPQRGPLPHPGVMRPPVFGMQPRFMPRMPMGMMSRASVAPPAYSPQMAENFRARHRTPEQEEQLRKQRQYQEQRIKLQNFGNVGPAGRSGANAERMIESMFGKAEKPKAKPPADSKSSDNDQGDDGFGDFMAGPSVSTQSAAPAPAPGAGASAQPPHTPTQTPDTNDLHPTNPTVAATPANSEKKEQVPEKDLMSMMLECSDLSAPKQAKHFHQRRMVKNVVPTTQVTTAVHKPSQKAHNWAGAGNISELFQSQVPPGQPPSDAPTPAPQETLPNWARTRDTLPPLYRQVEEAVTVDGKICTERLYPILLLSGLSRESLGYIWALGNQSTPGQLQPLELYMVLAMIALAQNNYNIPSVAILAKCPAPPVPYLGPNSQATPTPQQPVNHPPQSVSQAKTDQSAAVGAPHLRAKSSDAPSSTAGQPGVSHTSAGPVAEATKSDLEFTDFQGPATPAVTPADDFGDFKTADQTQDNPGNKPVSVLSSPLRLEENLSPEEQHSNVTNFFCSDDSSSAPFTSRSVSTLPKKGPTTPNSLDDYFFDDGKSAGSKISDSSQFSHSDLSDGEDFKNFDMYVEQFATVPPSQRTVTSPSKARVHQQPNGGLGHVTKTPQPIRAPTGASAWGNSGKPPNPTPVVIRSPQLSKAPVHLGRQLPPPPSGEDDFADFQTAAAAVPKAQPSELNLMGDENSEDKYAALRGWTEPDASVEPKSLLDTDASPLSEQTALPGGAVATDQSETQVDDNDWADFKDYSEFVTSSNEFPSSETVAIESTIQPMKTDDGEPYFPPPMKTAHTNSSFPPMAMADLPSNTFEGDQSCDQTDVFTVPKTQLTLPTLGTHTPVKPSNKFAKSPSLTKDSPVDKELQAVDFDSSRVPPPMDFQEEAEDEFVIPVYGEAFPTLDPHSPTFEASFNQQHPHKPSTTAGAPLSSVWPGLSSNQSYNISSKPFSKPQPTNDLSDSDKSDGQGQAKEDSQSVSSLELGYASQKPGLRKLGDPDSQSNNSTEFGGFESGGNVGMGNAESKSVDSFDLQEETLHDAQTSEPKQCPESKSLDSLDLKKVDSREMSPDEGEDTTPAPIPPDSAQLPVSAQALLQNGTLPTLGDRYSGVIQEAQGSDRHVFEWERCLESASRMINNANSVFNSISSSAVCNEIIQCGSGTDYLLGVVEIYRVVCRISLAMKASGISSDKLTAELKGINLGWTNLTAFIATSPIMPDPSSLDYRIAVLKSDDTASQLKACGVCLLNVNSRSKAFNEDKEGSKLTYGGRQYHTTCANFWVNCVSPMLPALRLPDLL